MADAKDITGQFFSETEKYRNVVADLSKLKVATRRFRLDGSDKIYKIDEPPLGTYYKILDIQTGLKGIEGRMIDEGRTAREVSARIRDELLQMVSLGCPQLEEDGVLESIPEGHLKMIARLINDVLMDSQTGKLFEDEEEKGDKPKEERGNG